MPLSSHVQVSHYCIPWFYKTSLWVFLWGPDISSVKLFWFPWGDLLWLGWKVLHLNNRLVLVLKFVPESCAHLEGVVVHHICFVPSRFTPLYLRLLLLFYALSAICERISCIWTTSSGPWSYVSTHRCCCWRSPYAPKGWFLLTSSWHQGWSILLILLILSHFPFVQPISQGVTRGRRAP